jgi:DNA adenine methylase
MKQLPLKWAGGKSALLSRIQPIWEQHKEKVWVDLFAGGLSLPLNLELRRAFINDINPHLINFWRWVRDDGIIDDYEFRNEENYYYQIREEFRKTHNPKLFYYLNRTGYNGLYRESSKSGFNVPFGKYKTINYKYNFTRYKPILEEWEFSNKSFENVELHKDDFVFADPPYHGCYNQYSSGGFTWNHQVKLVEKLALHEGVVIATNSDNEEIKKLYQTNGFVVETISMPRGIGNKKQVKEMFVFKGI